MPTIKVFEPEAKNIHQVFEPEAIRGDFASTFNNRNEVEAILSRYSSQDLEQMLNEEIARMDEPTKRTMLRKAGSVKGFCRMVMAQIVAKLVAGKIVDKYGPAALSALGIGAAGIATNSAVEFFSNLSTEQQEMFGPLFENSPLLQAMMSSNAGDAVDSIDLSDIGDFFGGIIDWLGALFS
jgi:hypothetical protein